LELHSKLFSGNQHTYQCDVTVQKYLKFPIYTFVKVLSIKCQISMAVERASKCIITTKQANRESYVPTVSSRHEDIRHYDRY
jgi:hypothetical protein